MVYLDLRSDTSTMPTEEMYKKIYDAKLGNEGYGEDPTVNELENMAASLLNKESALLFPTGIMANLTSLMVHCNPGDQVILEEDSHMFLNEIGGIARVANLLTQTIKGNMGIMEAKQIERFIRPKTDKLNGTGLMCIENTHNKAGGTIYSQDDIYKIGKIASLNNIPLHIDGARIFNASVELNIDIKDLVEPADSIMFCLSKGLGCPMGSMLVGSKEFISKARKVRKMLGGTMRQAGIIAGPGIVALSSMINSLKEDHIKAKKLAKSLKNLSFIKINMDTVQTNIIRFKIKALDENGLKFKKRLKDEGILIDYQGVDHNGYEDFRMVTHRDINRESIDKIISCIERVD